MGKLLGRLKKKMVEVVKSFRLSYAKINSGVLKGEVDIDLKKMVEVVKGFRISISGRKEGKD